MSEELREIVIQIQSWLDYQEREYQGKVTDDTHLMSPPVWPTRGMLKNWIAALSQQTEPVAKEYSEFITRLSGLCESAEFWENLPYQTRLYYGPFAGDYIQRGILRGFVEAITRAADQVNTDTVSVPRDVVAYSCVNEVAGLKACKQWCGNMKKCVAKLEDK